MRTIRYDIMTIKCTCTTTDIRTAVLYTMNSQTCALHVAGRSRTHVEANHVSACTKRRHVEVHHTSARSRDATPHAATRPQAKLTQKAVSPPDHAHSHCHDGCAHVYSRLNWQALRGPGRLTVWNSSSAAVRLPSRSMHQPSWDVPSALRLRPWRWGQGAKVKGRQTEAPENGRCADNNIGTLIIICIIVIMII